MKMRCMFRSVVRGDVVKVGQVLDLTEAECRMDVVKAYFVKADGDAAPEAARASAKSSAGGASGGVVAGLTRDQAVMKLAQAGVKVKGNATNASIAALYETTFANLAEASAKK